MKKAKLVGIYVLLAGVLVAGIGLPSLVAYVQDNKINETVETVNVKSVQLNMGSELSELQKLEMTAQSASVVELDSAQTMEPEEALAAVYDGLTEIFSAMEETAELFSVGDFAETEHSVLVKISGENSLLYWEFSLEDDRGNVFSVILDDDSGRILSFSLDLSEETLSGMTLGEAALVWAEEASAEDEETQSEDEKTLFEDEELFADEESSADDEGSSITLPREGLLLFLESYGIGEDSYAQHLIYEYCSYYFADAEGSVAWSYDSLGSKEAGFWYRTRIEAEEETYLLTVEISPNGITLN